GIGYETALKFAARGKNLIIVARRLDKLEELKTAIHNINPELDVIIRTVDLSVTEQAYNLYNNLKGYEIETWINNAGLGESAFVADQNLSKVETMLRVNIESLTILSTLFVRDFAEKEGTQLINVSSALGYAIAVGTVTYSASKYYVSAFTEG
ncbi:SDR family NAD(P)-dependent oxidoreductase, partial [Terribacillus saccharophilus]